MPEEVELLSFKEELGFFIWQVWHKVCYKNKFLFLNNIKKILFHEVLEPENLLDILRLQENQIFYEFIEYKIGSSTAYSRKILLNNKKMDYTLDIIYCLVKAADDKLSAKIRETFADIEFAYREGFRRDIPNLSLLKNLLKEVFNIDVQFINLNNNIKYESTIQYKEYELFEKGEKVDISDSEFLELLELGSKKPYEDSSKIQLTDAELLKNNLVDTKSPKAKEKIKKKSNSTKKIKLESCNKADLLTIDGFDEHLANKFISERNKGKMYYEIDTFVKEYKLQPHQRILIQDRLIFPAKPSNKLGRRIDW